MKLWLKTKAVIDKWQDFTWGKVIVPLADKFRLDPECEYCWWWRGVLFGSVMTSLVFILSKWVM